MQATAFTAGELADDLGLAHAPGFWRTYSNHGGAEAIPVTVSIGIAEFDPGDAASDSILARADAALYRAKEGGRNRVEGS